MKIKRNPIDEYFKEALDDYQIAPSEKARKALLDEVLHSSGSRFRNWYWLVLLLLIIASVALITIIRIYPSTEVKSLSVNKSNLTEHNNDQSSTNVAKNPDRLQVSQTENFLNHRTSGPSTIKKTKNKFKITKQNVEPTILASLNQSMTILSDTNVPIMNSTTPVPIVEPASIPPDTVGISGERSQPADIKSDTTKLPPLSPPVQSQKPRPDREWRISSGLYYSPEWMFHTLEGTKPVTNFGLEGTFRFGRYSVRTGAGLSIAKGTNQLAVEYNEYLGSYLKLDSMSFAWNLQHNDLIPTFYLTNKEVWDSLMKLENAKIIKRYTYLQVPLILGYDVFSNGKFSVGFRVGPIMSILLKTKTLSDEYDPGKKQIISINLITPEQISLNWQLLGGINVSYRVSRRFGLEIEPFGKYYLNSVYEYSDGSTKPWSLGLRAAVFISF